jgi:hypothetical protein
MKETSAVKATGEDSRMSRRGSTSVAAATKRGSFEVHSPHHLALVKL